MKTNTEKFLYSIFAIIGIALIIVGIIYSKYSLDFKKTAIETNAVITSIDGYTDSDGDTLYNVYVEFEANEKKNHGNLGYYSSGMHRGGNVTIYYNPAICYDIRRN